MNEHYESYKLTSYINEMAERYKGYLRSDIGKMDLLRYADNKFDLINSSVGDHLCEISAFIVCRLIYEYDTNPVDSDIKAVAFRYIKEMYDLYTDGVNTYCIKYNDECNEYPGARDYYLKAGRMMAVRLGKPDFQK